MAETFKHDVFIAHSAKDKAIADAICATLERNRIRCWIAPRDVRPGMNWGEAIIEGINDSRVMVIVFSSEANASPQVLREVERAVNRRIPIIPFRIEAVQPTKSMEYFLSMPHWLDALTPPLESHLVKLVSAVQQIVPPQPTATLPPQHPGRNVRKQSIPKGILIGLGSLFLACCLVWLGYAILSSRGSSPTPVKPEPLITIIDPPPKEPNSIDEPDNLNKIAKNSSTPDSPEPSIASASTGMQLLYIPGGKLTMGSPASEKDRSEDENSVEVELSPFYLGKYEVTQGEWKSVMNTEPWKGRELVKEGIDYPATFVSHDDAVAFCTKLSAKDGKAYRLPTEAEWEYACRAGGKLAYSFGADESKLSEYAWYDKNAFDIGEKYAHRVSQKKPNAYGLYDMHGNVWEWCSDWYGQKLVGGKNPAGPHKSDDRVLRGGSWNVAAQITRTAFRYRDASDLRYYSVGFRVSLVPSSK